MEEDKVNPDFQPSSPLPSWLEGQALSGQWVGAGGGSEPPLSETEEEEEPLVDTDPEWRYQVAQELSQGGVVGGQELCLWQEVVREFCQWQEDVTVQEFCPWGAERHQQLHQWQAGARVQRGDGAQRELCHWQASATAQELDQWAEDEKTRQEFSQWEEDGTGQELSQGQGEAYQRVSPLEEDVRGHLRVRQGEGDERETQLSRVGDNSDEELSQGKHYNVQELPQVQKDVSNQKWSQREEGVSSQGLFQWGGGASHEMWGKPSRPERNENAQICAQERPGSPSSVGTQAAGEAASELPSVSPAPGSPLDTELAAAAPAKGVQEEEPAEPVAPQVEQAPGSPFPSEEAPSAETDSSVCAPHSPPDGSQAAPDLDQDMSPEMGSKALLEVQASGWQPEEHRDLEQSLAAELEAAAPGDREESSISSPASPSGCSQAELDIAQDMSPEMGSKALLEVQAPGQQPEEHRNLEQSLAAELGAAAPGDREESPNSAPHSPCCSPSPLPCPLATQGHREQQEEAERGVVLAEQDREEGALAGELELSQVHQEEAAELSQGDAGSYQDVSQGEACPEQELSPVQDCSDQELSDWDECSAQELSQGEGRSCQDFSDWEECSQQGLSHAEAGSSQKLSDWEESSEPELSHGEVDSYQDMSDWEESIGQEVLRGNGNRPSVQSSWEDDSDKELEQDNWQSGSGRSIAVKPLLQEDDEWDEVSLLELCEEEDREKRLAGFAEDGLPLPVPREAWVERQAFEPCHQVPLCASPPHLQAQGLRGHAASPAFQEQLPEAGTLSPLPAPHSCPSPSAPQTGAPALGQHPAPRKKRPSRLRRALRALRSLFRCPCLAARPED